MTILGRMFGWPHRAAPARAGLPASTPHLTLPPPRLPEPVAARAPAPEPALAHEPPELHARTLWRWLCEGWEVDSADPHAAERAATIASINADPQLIAPDGCIRMLAADVLDEYVQMCIELGWHKRSWNSVAPHLRAMTGSEKRYIYYRIGDAEAKSRLCVYDIPKFGAARPVRLVGAGKFDTAADSTKRQPAARQAAPRRVAA